MEEEKFRIPVDVHGSTAFCCWLAWLVASHLETTERRAKNTGWTSSYSKKAGIPRMPQLQQEDAQAVLDVENLQIEHNKHWFTAKVW